MHCTSPAKAACSMLKSVVAKVVIPSFSKNLHACSPSHVLGIFRQIRLVSKSGSRCLKMEIIPDCFSLCPYFKQEEGNTLPILNHFFGAIRMIRIRLNMDKACDYARDCKL